MEQDLDAGWNTNFGSRVGYEFQKKSVRMVLETEWETGFKRRLGK